MQNFERDIFCGSLGFNNFKHQYFASGAGYGINKINKFTVHVQVIVPAGLMKKGETKFLKYCYHLNKALAQVKPLPKAARQIKSPSLIFPISHASHKAIGTEAAVVLPYF